MSLVEHVARKGARIGVYKILVGNPERGNHLEVLGIEGRVALTWILGSWFRAS
jgi:hypothetical protein